jgi:hypothetical protein
MDPGLPPWMPIETVPSSGFGTSFDIKPLFPPQRASKHTAWHEREARPRTREGVKHLPAQYLDTTAGVVQGVNR